MTDSKALLVETADRLAILDCLARYCRGIDRMDAQVHASVYWPDGIESRGTHIYEGPAPGFIDWVKGFIEPLRTQHFLGQSIIEFTGAGTANVETYVQAYHLGKGNFNAEELIVGARYLDKFEKRGDEWRIKHRTMVVDYHRTKTASETDRYVVGGANLGKKAPHDLLYSAFL